MVLSKQHDLPPFHLNLLRAIRQDWLEDSDPSTRVFIRAWIFGYLAETLPASLRVLLSIFPLAKKRGIAYSLRKALRAWSRILQGASGRRGLALLFALSMGGAKWLEDRIVYPVLTSRHVKNLLRRESSHEDTPELDLPVVQARNKLDRKARQISTFLSILISTCLAFSLQHQTTVSADSSSSSRLPLVSFTGTSTAPSQGAGDAASLRSRPLESNTLDMTLFLLVRALDTGCRTIYESLPVQRYRALRAVLSKGDLALFVLSSWRIMWVWFYKPWLLPSSYNSWIHSLARMDERLLQLLRHASIGEWQYGQVPSTAFLRNLGPSICEEVGAQPQLGMPDRIKAFPCEIVHGKLVDSGSCEVNIGKRWVVAWLQSLLLYLPVHAIPLVLFSYKRILKAPLAMLLKALLGASRSAAFLATFVASVWAGVCYGRTRLGPHLIPDQQIWDGGLAMQLGTFICGFSVLIENKRRRGEMALFAAPRALYTILDDGLPSWIVNDKRLANTVERLVFSLSCATIVTSSVHKPEYVRGIVRSLSRFLVKGWRPSVSSH